MKLPRLDLLTNEICSKVVTCIDSQNGGKPFRNAGGKTVSPVRHTLEKDAVDIFICLDDTGPVNCRDNGGHAVE